MYQVKYGVMFDQKEAEGTKRRHQVDTVVEGMSALSSSSVALYRTHTPYSGINRLTKNMDYGLSIINDAFRYVQLQCCSPGPV